MLIVKNKIKRLDKICASCNRKIRVIFHKDKSYRGGHYFGKIPLYTKKEFNKALRFGTTKKYINKLLIEVLNKDPRPYKYEEYWECPECYWRR